MQKFDCFLINLKKDTDRLHFMESQLNKLKIPFKRVEAINGKEYDFSGEYSETICALKNGKAMTLGELGCAKSHKICHELALKSENGYSLVLEDDVELPENLKDIIEKEIEINERNVKNGKNYFEYLSFDYVKPGPVFLQDWLNSIFVYREIYMYNFSLIKKIKYYIFILLKFLYIFPVSLFEVLRNFYYYKFNKNKSGKVKFYRPLYLAGAYLVKKEGVRKLSQEEEMLTYPADRVQNEAKKKQGLSFYAYAPLSVFQRRDYFGSSILGLDKDEFKKHAK